MIKVFGEHDERTKAQLERCMGVGSAVSGVLCADGHLGYAMPVGGVIAYEEHISVSGVGFDIGCGNTAVRLDTRYDQIKDHVGTILADVQRSVSFGVGRKNNERVEHPLFDSPTWDEVSEITPLREMAQKQLGTVGSGNHYVDLFEDESGFVWIGVHFGSRGFGHKTATAFLKLGGGTDGMDVDPCVLHQDSELGERYVRAMRLAGVYAYAGREWVVEKVNSIIGGTIAEEVNNHHNYAWREEHGGQDYWVVRKGATPAFPGQHGFVGGSMGDDAVILSGVDSEVSKASLYSTVHGAGRVMSRTQARGKWRKGVQRTEGLIRYDDWQTWLREKGVTVLGGDVDEAPQAYRRLPDVLQAHAGTVQVEHTLRPFGVVMAGSKEFDPYKD